MLRLLIINISTFVLVEWLPSLLIGVSFSTRSSRVGRCWCNFRWHGQQKRIRKSSLLPVFRQDTQMKPSRSWRRTVKKPDERVKATLFLRINQAEKFSSIRFVAEWIKSKCSIQERVHLFFRCCCFSYCCSAARQWHEGTAE